MGRKADASTQGRQLKCLRCLLTCLPACMHLSPSLAACIWESKLLGVSAAPVRLCIHSHTDIHPRKNTRPVYGPHRSQGDGRTWPACMPARNGRVLVSRAVSRSGRQPGSSKSQCRCVQGTAAGTEEPAGWHLKGAGVGAKLVWQCW